jgi:hypothetical protein
MQWDKGDRPEQTGCSKQHIEWFKPSEAIGEPMS